MRRSFDGLGLGYRALIIGRPPVRRVASSVGKAEVVDVGERMLLWCKGGPSIGRATTFPPPLEISVDGGTYVLVDDGAPEAWHYLFVEDRGSA